MDATAPFSSARLRASSSAVDRASYGRDLWPRHLLAIQAGDRGGTDPRVVVWPENVEEVARTIEICEREGLSLVPFGAGSGVCGGVTPDDRTVVLDLKRLARFSIDPERGILDAEAGVLGLHLEEDLQRHGFTLGHFPSSILCSTVGGWIAARSAGQTSGRYGKIEDMVLGLDTVLGGGERITFARRSHGPDACPLIVGSEGIFGVVTGSRLRIHRAATHTAVRGLSFPTMEHGYEAMREMFQAGLRPAVSRLYDAFDAWMAKQGGVKKKPKSGPKEPSIARDAKHLAMRNALARPRFLNAFVDGVGDKVFGGAMLILVFEGWDDGVFGELRRAMRIAERHGGGDLGEGPARKWIKHRYSVSYRQAPLFMAGGFSDTMEVAAPWSRLDEMYRSIRAALSPHVFVMAHMSHAYPDGCSIYFTFAGSAPSRAEAEATYDAAWRAALDAVVASGGTVSHHHGVGRSKAPKLGDEAGLGVQVVGALKQVLDPRGIFNPGNLLPRTLPQRRATLAPPDAPVLDERSLLVRASGAATLGSLEALAQARGLTLGIDAMDATETLAAFVARGAPGTRSFVSDPVDHFVAGFAAELASGHQLVVRPGPRKAAGPDLLALFWGTRERAGKLTEATIRLHRNGLDAPTLPFRGELAPVQDPREAAMTDRLVERAGRVTFDG